MIIIKPRYRLIIFHLSTETTIIVPINFFVPIKYQFLIFFCTQKVEKYYNWLKKRCVLIPSNLDVLRSPEPKSFFFFNGLGSGGTVSRNGFIDQLNIYRAQSGIWSLGRNVCLKTQFWKKMGPVIQNLQLLFLQNFSQTFLIKVTALLYKLYESIFVV